MEKALVQNAVIMHPSMIDPAAGFSCAWSKMQHNNGSASNQMKFNNISMNFSVRRLTNHK